MLPSLYERGYIVSYKEGDISLQRTPIPSFNSPLNNYHIVRDSDTLLSLAQEYYNDQFLWYIIADVNPTIEDIFELVPNTTLIIPSLTDIQLVYG